MLREPARQRARPAHARSAPRSASATGAPATSRRHELARGAARDDRVPSRVPHLRAAAPDGARRADRRARSSTPAVAARRERATRHRRRELFDFLRDVLLLRVARRPPEARARACASSSSPAPVMAKGVEDTAFYRYTALRRAERGRRRPGALRRRRRPSFHARQPRARRAGRARMLATSTHDTKRSEDVRARIARALGDARAWADGRARAGRRSTRGTARERRPTATPSTCFYQTLVGAWPIAARTRLPPTCEKATREAKAHTSLDRARRRRTRPRSQRFVDAILDDGDFVADAASASSRRLVGAGPGELARADAAQAHRARRARHLPGHRAVGPEPGRSRQPSRRSTSTAPARCWPSCDGAGAGSRPGARATRACPSLADPAGARRAPPRGPTPSARAAAYRAARRAGRQGRSTSSRSARRRAS